MNEAERVRQLVRDAIEKEGVFPGAVWAVNDGDAFFVGTAGRQTWCPDDPRMTPDTLFDLASVSKVVGTTTVAMRLTERGVLDLDRPVARDLPEFGKHLKDGITPRLLLLHETGIIAFRPFHRLLKDPNELWPAICDEKLLHPAGTKAVYSDLNMMTLAILMERLTGKPLDALVEEEPCRPLGLKHTLYRPRNPRTGHKPWTGPIAPSERVEDWRQALREKRGETRLYDDPVYIRGEVHDPAATFAGGIAGHAGLFSTVGDLVTFSRALLAGKVAREWREWVRRQGVPGSSRALGWDTRSPEGSSAGSKLGPRAFGHTGYTGTSMWLDPDDGRFAVLLTNRVHPSAANTKIIPWRAVFHDAAFAR